MKTLLWVLIIAIIIVIAVFVLAKWMLKQKLDSIDGFGGTTKNQDDTKIISAFGNSDDGKS